MRIEIFKAVPTYFHKIPRTKDFIDYNIYNEAAVTNILQKFANRIKILREEADSDELFPN